MLLGRFFMVIPMLAIAGNLAQKKTCAGICRHVPGHTPLFAGLLVSVIVIVGALTFFPALSLGPILEHLLMNCRKGFLRTAMTKKSHDSLEASSTPAASQLGSRDGSAIARRGAVLRFVPQAESRTMIKNPVMFVVEVGRRAHHRASSCATSLRHSQRHSASSCRSRSGCGSRCCSPISPKPWPKAAAKPRPTRCAKRARKPCAQKLKPDGSTEEVAGSQAARRRSSSSSTAGEFIPGDGEVIEGVASVDESAITGESAPVIRESGGDRSAVTGGTRVLSDRDQGPHHLESRRNISRPHDRAGRRRRSRQKTPNEIALNILLAGLTIIFLLAVVTLQPFAIYSGAPQSDRSCCGLAAGLPDSDHDRRTALGHRHRRHGPRDAAQRAGHVRHAPWKPPATWTRCCSTKPEPSRSAIARPPNSIPRPAYPTKNWPMPRNSPRSPTKRPKAAPSWCWPRRSTACAAASSPRTRPRSFRSPRTRACPASISTAAQSAKALPTPSPKHCQRTAATAFRAEVEETVEADLERRRHAAAGRRRSRILGVIHLKDIVKGGMKSASISLRAMGIRTVMITGDNPLTAAAIAREAGVDDFLAEAKPEDKLALIKSEQAKGKLVAMTGDGTNDAPALAQADVGVAMNTGTRRPKKPATWWTSTPIRPS